MHGQFKHVVSLKGHDFKLSVSDKAIFVKEKQETAITINNINKKYIWLLLPQNKYSFFWSWKILWNHYHMRLQGIGKTFSKTLKIYTDNKPILHRFIQFKIWNKIASINSSKELPLSNTGISFDYYNVHSSLDIKSEKSTIARVKSVERSFWWPKIEKITEKCSMSKQENTLRPSG